MLSRPPRSRPTQKPAPKKTPPPPPVKSDEPAVAVSAEISAGAEDVEHKLESDSNEDDLAGADEAANEHASDQPSLSTAAGALAKTPSSVPPRADIDAQPPILMSESDAAQEAQPPKLMSESDAAEEAEGDGNPPIAEAAAAASVNDTTTVEAVSTDPKAVGGSTDAPDTNEAAPESATKDVSVASVGDNGDAPGVEHRGDNDEAAEGAGASADNTGNNSGDDGTTEESGAGSALDDDENVGDGNQSGLEGSGDDGEEAVVDVDNEATVESGAGSALDDDDENVGDGNHPAVEDSGVESKAAEGSVEDENEVPVSDTVSSLVELAASSAYNLADIAAAAEEVEGDGNPPIAAAAAAASVNDTTTVEGVDEPADDSSMPVLVPVASAVELLLMEIAASLNVDDMPKSASADSENRIDKRKSILFSEVSLPDVSEDTEDFQVLHLVTKMDWQRARVGMHK